MGRVLFIVDVQNDFVADEGAMAKIGRPVAEVQAMVPNLQRLVDDARVAGVPLSDAMAEHEELRQAIAAWGSLT